MNAMSYDDDERGDKRESLSLSLLICAMSLMLSCTEGAQPINSLSVELGSCWGAIEEESSCSHLVLSDLPPTRVGCWALSRGEQTYRMLMSWDGQQLTPANDEQVTPLPFGEGDEVMMRLFLFDEPISTGQCERLDLSLSCADTTGCRARLERSAVTLRLNMWLGFRDDEDRCQFEVMSGDERQRCTEVSDAHAGEPAGAQGGDPTGEPAGEPAGAQGGEAINTCAPEPERCDLIDNDCDSIIDEMTERGEPCMRSFVGCAGDFPGRYECTTLGAECAVESLPSLNSDELCDGLDNNCDGVIDNVTQVGEACQLQVTRECARSGVLVCEAMPSAGTMMSLTCQPPPDIGERCDGDDDDCDGLIDEGLSGRVERCDGRDDDCDGVIDEDQACGRLIAQRCAVSLGWARIQEDSSSLPFMWDQLPPNAADPTCRMYDQRDEPTYSCDTATLGQGFRVLQLPSQLSNRDWLGVAWTCDVEERPDDPTPPSEIELETLEWARQRCGVALAYSDYDWSGSRISSLIPELCPTFARYTNINFIPRCVLTREPSRYAALELEGVVNVDDQLGIAFLCDRGDEVSAREREISRQLEAQLQISLGVHQEVTRAQDGALTWGDLPLQDTLERRDYRGVRSTDRGHFNHFKFIGNGQPQELAVQIQVR